MSKFFNGFFFPGISVCTYTTAASVSEILSHIGPLNKTDAAYASSISPVHAVQKFNLKFWFYHIIIRIEATNTQSGIFLWRYGLRYRSHNKIIFCIYITKLFSFLVPQVPKIFRSDGSMYKGYSWCDVCLCAKNYCMLCGCITLQNDGNMLTLHHIYKLSRMLKKRSKQEKKVMQQLIQQVDVLEEKNTWNICIVPNIY